MTHHQDNFAKVQHPVPAAFCPLISAVSLSPPAGVYPGLPGHITWLCCNCGSPYAANEPTPTTSTCRDLAQLCADWSDGAAVLVLRLCHHEVHVY